MWTPEHRQTHDRKGLRYPSDLTDAEWTLVAPLIPPARRGGRRREVDMREVLNAVFYVLSTGCQWDAVPKDLPPKSTCTTTSRCGAPTGRCCGCIRPCMSSSAKRRASATTAVLAWARDRSPRSQAPRRVSLFLSVGIAALAPWISILRRYLLPRLVMPRSRGLPPVVA